MKILFAGTPEFAVLPLKKITEAAAAQGWEVVGVVTQTDKPQGRKGILTPSPVKAFALAHGLPVFQPIKIRDEATELKKFGADVMVTCAYGQLLTADVLEAFEKGVWNIHASLLPAYRGASPIQSALLNGDKQTGVTVMKTELGLDSGDILSVAKTEIGERETYGELAARLSQLGADLIVEALKKIAGGDYELTAQDESAATLVRKISKESAKIDFSLPAERIINLVRASNPEPVAYAFMGEGGVRLNIFRVEKANYEGSEEAANGEILSDVPKKGLLVKCGDGALNIIEAQAAGGKRVKGSDLLNGRKLKKGDILC